MRVGTVLVCHPSHNYFQQLKRELTEKQYVALHCWDCKTLRSLIAHDPPEILVTELRLPDGPTLGPIAQLRQGSPRSRIVVVTDHGSIATALRCNSLGVAGYYTLPASIEQILSDGNVGSPPVAVGKSPELPLRLDRAIWEYLNRVVDTMGSIAGAADVLGLDRRSLRRMLSKCAPPI